MGHAPTQISQLGKPAGQQWVWPTLVQGVVVTQGDSPLGQRQRPLMQKPVQHSLLRPPRPAGTQGVPAPWQLSVFSALLFPTLSIAPTPPTAVATAALKTVRRETGPASFRVNSSNCRSSINSSLPHRCVIRRCRYTYFNSARDTPYLKPAAPAGDSGWWRDVQRSACARPPARQ